MTSTIERESISEALALIDKELVRLVKRDLVTTNEVADLLLDVRRTRGTTLVLVTHDPALAALADSRLVLMDGRPVEEAR